MLQDVNDTECNHEQSHIDNHMGAPSTAGLVLELEHTNKLRRRACVEKQRQSAALAEVLRALSAMPPRKMEEHLRPQTSTCLGDKLLPL